jgi:Ca2+-binding EF-hand superfamily protein
LCHKQVEEIRKVWNIFDQNGDGRIERKELAAVLKQLSGGKTFEQHEIQELWNTMDANKDGLPA